MNPDPQGDGLKLNISDAENAQDLGLVMEVAPYFRLREDRAEAVMAEILGEVREWRRLAAELGFSKDEIENVAPAFRLV